LGEEEKEKDKDWCGVGLNEYKAKRNFRKTAEPAGRVGPQRKARLSFVVQKHAATRLHYDFRLEMQGVLKSWAVPKGFPTTRGDRRLAVQVEDHPLDYGGFEGTIPPGNYGAGTVMLWDHGTYEVSGDNPLEALKSGKLHLILHGKKLADEWTLVRMRRLENADKPQWLLLKSGEDVEPIPEKLDDQSVVSRRSMKQIAAAGDNEWESNRGSDEAASARTGQSAADVPRSKRVRGRVSSSSRRSTAKSKPPTNSPEQNRAGADTESLLEGLDGLPRAEPAFREPMKALLVERLPQGRDWLYEVKFDGIRAVAIKSGQTIELISRTANELTSRFPSIAQALANLAVKKAVLDGEIVALDAEGRSSFQLLQSFEMAGGSKPPLLYYVFDLLNLEGRDLVSLPLRRRKALAESLVSAVSPLVRFSPALEAPSEQVIGELKARGLEGLIAKKRDSKYEFGRRSGAWAKFKWTTEQEFVIGGFTRPQGSRSHFGAILVGYYRGEDLIFVGKVGTGFNEKMLDSLHVVFEKLIQPDCPFANLPERLSGSGAKGLTAGEMRKCTWLRPELVCQVRFAEWTRDSHLRQPAFVGLREDRPAKEVTREVAK
jgi:bifunctional non-homologous end joining protein LigD